MSGFQLVLQTAEPELSGTPVVVDVLDQDLRLVTQQEVSVGHLSHFEVPTGRYGVRILLPSGKSLTDSVDARESALRAHVIDLSEVSPHEFLQRTVLLKAAPRTQQGSLDDRGYRSVWLRLWVRSEDTWSVERWPEPQAIWLPDVVRYQFQTRRRQYMLQLGGHRIPWRMVSLPAADSLEVTIRPSGDQETPSLAVTVATDNNAAEALLGYLNIGALNHATIIKQQAEALLFGKRADPAAAAVGGYYLLRVSDLERLHDWPRNLATWMAWMPDGPVIHAWQLIREQQEAETRSETALRAARAQLLQAVERGIPVYTEGLRLLISGLKLVNFEARGRDRDVRDALDLMQPIAAAADLGQTTTTFTGSSPWSGSRSPAYGLPESWDGLAFLYDVQLQDLVNSGLIAPESSLYLTSVAQVPVEAQITAQGRIQLADGREHSDLSKAATEAMFPDPWLAWRVPGAGTLADLRQQARNGRIRVKLRRSERLREDEDQRFTTPITVTFYDIKTRQSVEVPQSEVTKTKYERTTKAGKVQVRYALRGKYQGRNLTKFVNQATWEAMDVSGSSTAASNR